MANNSTAPGDLELVRSFVNTVEIEPDHVDETLLDPEALRRWLVEHGLPVGDRPLREPDLRRAIEVREALRAFTLANNGHPLDPDAVGTLNELATSAPLQVSFDDKGRPHLGCMQEGIDAALAALLAIVYRSMAEGTWPRLKGCYADSCMWAFYDHSKNRSGTWCSMAVCGNRAKARAHRARHRRDASPGA
jgi:predicted RNA-binding Zn ribbon-like protein